MTTRIGPRMREAAAYVALHPGCAILPAARSIAPYGRGIKFGYAAVHRAIRAGLIVAGRGVGNAYCLTPPNSRERP
jgi:hypothetical protein